MTDTLTMITTTEAFEEFLQAKADGLTRRTLRNYREVLDLLTEYLEEHGLTRLARGPAGAEAAEEMIDLLDDFNDVYLVQTIKAERDFLRIAGQATRDLGRWLKKLTSARTGATKTTAARVHA